MSHKAQQHYVRRIQSVFPSKFRNVRVLEVGSLDINGTVRDHFVNCDYLGIDVGEGKCVDKVIPGQDFDGASNSFDTVISCECFEHNPEWVATFKNMHRVCKPGGLVIMTCATDGRPEHGTTRTTPGCSPLTLDWNYYKNLNESHFRKALELQEMFITFEFFTNTQSQDLYFWGIKSDT